MEMDRRSQRPWYASRSLLLLGATVLAAFMIAGQAPNARAENLVDYTEFCPNAFLGPYGQSNDNCAGGGWGYHFTVQVYAKEHSACASTTTNGAKSGVNRSWLCTPGPYSSVANTVDPSVWTLSIIRNNTTGSSNHASGVAGRCSNIGCH